MMKKCFLWIVLLIVCFCPIKAPAQEGCITITLPKDYDKESEKQIAFSYEKVAKMENGRFVLQKDYMESGIDLNHLETAKELQEAAEELQKYTRQGGIASAGQDGIVRIENLEEGVYLLDDYGDSQYEMIPTLLYIPTWHEIEKEMVYDVLLEPKYEEEKSVPKTGDASDMGSYILPGVLSGIIVVILSCHNRFKCGRIRDKYSRKGRISQWE